MTFQLPEALSALERTPVVVHRLVDGLPRGWLTTRPTPHDWNAHEVIGHLLYTEEWVWAKRAHLILQGQGRPFPMSVAGDPSARYPGVSTDDLVRRFGDQRSRSVEGLERLELTPVTLELEGLHPALGRVSLRQLLAAWVVHDHNHLRQLHEALAAHYVNEVGPWRRMLGVLDRVSAAVDHAPGTKGGPTAAE